MSGYVRIHRSLLGHPAFRNESETMAFAWMIAKASWRQTRVRYKGHSLTLNRGQLAISQRDMAAAFDRDKAWIERLWKRLKSEAMIETQAEAGVAVITICNYDEYQGDGEEGEAPAKAPRKAANEAAARQRRGTEQEGKKGIKSSDTNVSGAAAPDPVKALFDLGVTILTDAGETEKQARSLIGKWRKAKSDGEVLTALIDCQARSVSNPTEWLEKRFKSARYISASGFEYHGSDEEVMRKAEQRADWSTYWKAKGVVEKRSATA